MLTASLNQIILSWDNLPFREKGRETVSFLLCLCTSSPPDKAALLSHLLGQPEECFPSVPSAVFGQLCPFPLNWSLSLTSQETLDTISCNLLLLASLSPCKCTYIQPIFIYILQFQRIQWVKSTTPPVPLAIPSPLNYILSAITNCLYLKSLLLL